MRRLKRYTFFLCLAMKRYTCLSRHTLFIKMLRKNYILLQINKIKIFFTIDKNIGLSIQLRPRIKLKHYNHATTLIRFEKQGQSLSGEFWYLSLWALHLKLAFTVKTFLFLSLRLFRPKNMIFVADLIVVANHSSPKFALQIQIQQNKQSEVMDFFGSIWNLNGRALLKLFLLRGILGSVTCFVVTNSQNYRS